MSRMTTVKRQNTRTWTNLHTRLRATSLDYTSLLPNPVGKFLNDHAKAISSCVGYVFDSLVATTGYILGENCRISYNGTTSKTNLYVIFVGPPSTGKSQAIGTACLDPLAAIVTSRDGDPVVVGKSTSAGLVQKLSEGGRMLVSSEIFEVLTRMVKNDGDTAAGDISMLSQIFSGERVSISYASQKCREISGDTAFSILGAIQPIPTAQLLTSLDTGNGFLERLLLHFPDCMRPTPSQTREARECLNGKPSLSQVLQVISQLHENGQEYIFSDESEKELDNINEVYIEQINAAIREGHQPPQSKKIDQIIRVAPIVHVLHSVIRQMLQGEEVVLPPRAIKQDSLTAAMQYVEFCKNQKETYLCELRNITECAVTPEIQQPKEKDVTRAVLKTPGPIITYRAFKSTCPKSLRSVNRAEYDAALKKASSLGSISSHRMEVGSRILTVFVKNKPADINWNDDQPISELDYTRAYDKRQPACITTAMQDTLVNAGCVSREMFTQ